MNQKECLKKETPRDKESWKRKYINIEWGKEKEKS